jgi:hypothetical protein
MARIYPFITFQNTQTVVIGVAAQVVLWDLQCIVTVDCIIRAPSLAKYQISGLSCCSCITYLFSVSHLFFLPARMVDLAMAMQAPLVKGHPWKTSMRQKLIVLMVR